MTDQPAQALDVEGLTRIIFPATYAAGPREERREYAKEIARRVIAHLEALSLPQDILLDGAVEAAQDAAAYRNLPMPPYHFQNPPYGSGSANVSTAPPEASAASPPAGAETQEEDALLPYRIQVGPVRFGKGVKLSTFVESAQRWYDRAALATGGAPASVPAGWREALELISLGVSAGHCSICKKPMWPVYECDCPYETRNSWEPNDPVQIAKAALAASPTPEKGEDR